MYFWLILGVILIIIVGIVDKAITRNNSNNMQSTPTANVEYDLSKYESKQYVMTQTELIFYRELKKITDELELSIFPQVDLERIIQVKDNNNSDRNRIKSRSIDFTIVNNKNCKIISCIELDDYTHNRESAKKADSFKNDLFQKVGIPLHRIKVLNSYNLEEIKSTLQCDIQLLKKNNCI